MQPKVVLALFTTIARFRFYFHYQNLIGDYPLIVAVAVVEVKSEPLDCMNWRSGDHKVCFINACTLNLQYCKEWSQVLCPGLYVYKLQSPIAKTTSWCMHAYI
jgi:hypothetical protein